MFPLARLMSAQCGTALFVPVHTSTNTVPRVIILVPASLSFPRVLTIALAIFKFSWIKKWSKSLPWVKEDLQMFSSWWPKKKLRQSWKDMQLKTLLDFAAGSSWAKQCQEKLKKKSSTKDHNSQSGMNRGNECWRFAQPNIDRIDQQPGGHQDGESLDSAVVQQDNSQPRVLQPLPAGISQLMAQRFHLSFRGSGTER